MTTPAVTWPRTAGPLVLQPPTRESIEQLLAWRNEPAVTRWLLRTTVEPEAFTAAWLDTVDDPDQHAVVALLDDVAVGTGSLDVSDAMGQYDRAGTIDERDWRRSEGMLGYMIDPKHAGNGYAGDIVRALLDLAFGELGLHRVTAGCFADNRASWRVMEKAGMRREQHGVRDSWHAELGWIDGYTYAILAEEWHLARGR